MMITGAEVQVGKKTTNITANNSIGSEQTYLTDGKNSLTKNMAFDKPEFGRKWQKIEMCARGKRMILQKNFTKISY